MVEEIIDERWPQVVYVDCPVDADRYPAVRAANPAAPTSCRNRRGRPRGW
jgi:hypothetical protein